MTTTATLEVDDDQATNQLRRVVLLTVGVLLPEEFNDTDIADIHITGVVVTGSVDTTLTGLIRTTVQEARLVMS